MERELDINNLWHAHAYFALGFHCEKCGKVLEIDSTAVPTSDEWCVALARAAFDQGWFIPLPESDGSMDFMSAWCPHCGEQLKMTQPKYDGWI